MFICVFLLRRDGDSDAACFALNLHSLPEASCANLLLQSAFVSKLTSAACSKIFAERRGFEPRKHFWRLHAFQACLFNHSSISPRAICAFSATKLLLFSHIRKNLSIFFINFTYFSPKSLFALALVALIMSSVRQLNACAKRSATWTMRRLSLRSPRWGTGAI